MLLSGTKTYDAPETVQAIRGETYTRMFAVARCSDECECGWVCERECGPVSGGVEDAAADSIGVDDAGAQGRCGEGRTVGGGRAEAHRHGERRGDPGD